MPLTKGLTRNSTETFTRDDPGASAGSSCFSTQTYEDIGRTYADRLHACSDDLSISTFERSSQGRGGTYVAARPCGCAGVLPNAVSVRSCEHRSDT